MAKKKVSKMLTLNVYQNKHVGKKISLSMMVFVICVSTAVEQTVLLG